MKDIKMFVVITVIWALASTGVYVIVTKIHEKCGTLPITEPDTPRVLWVNEPYPKALWHTVLTLSTTNGPVELGMRADGVVVWRHTK